MNKCDWCGKSTENPESYTAMSPLNKGRGIICNGCHEKDEIIYQKYRQLTSKGGDSYGMLKIVVDDDNTVDYDINEMEMWHDDVKEKVSKVGKDK